MLDELVGNIRQNAVSTIPFGQYENDDETDDEMIISDEDTWTVWFDHILDDLPGPSAPFIRLERFWNWSSHYERNMWSAFGDSGTERYHGTTGTASAGQIRENLRQV
jgi:hypothetical protein